MRREYRNWEITVRGTLRNSEKTMKNKLKNLKRNMRNKSLNWRHNYKEKKIKQYNKRLPLKNRLSRNLKMTKRNSLRA